MNPEMEKKIENLETVCWDGISALANARLEEMKAEFIQRFSKRPLRILFGNGTFLCEVSGHRLDNDGWSDYWPQRVLAGPLWFICEALNDVLEITEYFGRGCLNDVRVEGI